MANVICNEVEEVFNPLAFYEGNYIFPIDTLYDCSKVVNGRNLVKEYFYDNYLRKLNSLIDDFKLCMKGIALKSDATLTHNSRELKISLEFICYAICERFAGCSPELSGDYFKNKEILSDFFRKYKKAITALKNETSLEWLEKESSALIELYNDNEQMKKEFMGKDYIPGNFNSFLDKVRDCIVTFLVRYNQMAQVCDKPISLEALNDCLDLEKFEFAMANILIDLTKLVEQNDNKVHNSFIYVDLYMQKIQAFKELSNYDFKMKVTCFDWTKRLVKLDELINEWSAIRNRHPEYRTFSMDIADGVNYRDAEVMTGLLEKLRKLVESKELVASWNFVRKGQADHTNYAPREKKMGSKEGKTKEEKDRELRRRLDFFEQTSYLYRIEGINNFFGYVGYIYGNGKVIFEKFYKDLDSYELASENATYVMNLDNFIEMSKKTKVEIMQYIKDGETKVKRKYHTAKWEVNMSNLINETGYDTETLSLIDNLVSSSEIKKKGVNNV